jgi:hypothetical protein
MQVASSQAGQYRLFGCELIAKFVGFHSNQFPPVMDLEAYESLFAARGPHNFSETYNAGFLNDNGQAKLFNCRFEAVNGPTNSVGVWQQGPSSTANSFTELYGCVVKSEGAPTLNIDLVRGDPTRGQCWWMPAHGMTPARQASSRLRDCSARLASGPVILFVSSQHKCQLLVSSGTRPS